MKVFLSYAHADESVVKQLDAELAKHGVDAWYDRKPGVGLRGGEKWEDRLANELNASSFAVVVLSPDAVRTGSFVTNEYQFALNKHAHVIPLVRQDCTVPLSLTSLQYIDFAHQPFVDACSQLLGALNITTASTRPKAIAPNPFDDVSRIDNPAQFFDRERETKKIFDALAQNVCVSVIGASKIGKSSLLFQIAKQGIAKITNVRFAYMTLEVCNSGTSFYEHTCKALGETGQRNRDLAKLIDKGPRVVFCMDEMEKLCNSSWGDDVCSFLRGYADGSTAPLKLVVASRRQLSQILPDDAGKTSPLYNIFTEIINLTNFKRQECDRFLDARLANTGVTFDGTVRDEIWTLTQGHPYKVQRVAHHRYKNAIEPHYDWRTQVEADMMFMK